jgi:hypothetical protein
MKQETTTISRFLTEHINARNGAVASKNNGHILVEAMLACILWWMVAILRLAWRLLRACCKVDSRPLQTIKPLYFDMELIKVLSRDQRISS